MSETNRTNLPPRRPSETFELVTADQTMLVTIGFDPATDKPREVFMSGEKRDTDFDALLADIAVALSVALQHNVSAAALAKSVGRIPRNVLPHELDTAVGKEPASAVGAVLDLLQSVEAEYAT